MTDRFVSTTLDLSRLPPPQVIAQPAYEEILAARLARLKALLPDLDTTGLETEPAVILQQVDAWREQIALSAIQDGGRSVMLAFATGANLDQLGAFYGVTRLTIVPADPTTTPPTAAVMEADADLRARITLAPEALPYAGMTAGGYRALALRTAPSVKDVAALKRNGGRVDLVLLSRSGDGTVAADVVLAVYAAFQDDAATQLTDIVTVRSATIAHYSPTITIYVGTGPDPATVRASAEAAVRAYAADRNRVGAVVYAQMLAASASVPGVERTAVDIADVDPGADGAAFLDTLTVVAVTA